MRKLVSLFLALFLLGCGYKPASHYTKEAMGESIFADIKIPKSDPQSGVVLLDALNEAIVAKFGSKLTTRELAETTITITSASNSISALQRDKDGFITMYRSTVSLSTIVSNERLRGKSFSVSGVYDFAVEPSSVLSDNEKTRAAREASLKAFDQLTAKIILIGR